MAARPGGPPPGQLLIRAVAVTNTILEFEIDPWVKIH